MSEYASNVDHQQAADLLTSARRVLVTTHAKPDGDAFGAAVALSAALGGGAEVSVLLVGPVPANFRDLAGYELVTLCQPRAELPEADLVVIVDTGAWSQLEAMRARLEPHLGRTLIIDHHLSGDVPAAWRYVDRQAAATCELLGDLFARTGLGQTDDGLFDPVVAEALFVGLASDTGWFRFSNTRAQTLELSAKLLRSGVDHARLYRVLEEGERVEKLKLMIPALVSLRLLGDDRAALMVLKAEDFATSGALLEETERFVDLPQAVGSIEVVVLIVEPPPVGAAELAGAPNSGAIRLSFRSKPGVDAVNVAALAQRFGGGGHERAAGAKVIGPLDEVVARVAQAVTEAVGG